MNVEQSFDPEALLQVLADEGVEYLVIGGIAAGFYGSTRNTQDLDIVPAPGRRNAERLARALGRVHARLKGVDAHLLPIDPTDPDHLLAGANLTLQTDLGDLDFMPAAEAIRPWDELAARARHLPLAESLSVPVIGRDDLIAMKRVAGRRQDIEDIVQLTAGIQMAAAPARAHVGLRARIRPGTPLEEAIEAADVATAAFDRAVRIGIDHAASDRAVLVVSAELEGFTPAHAETWAQIVAHKLESAGVLGGKVERDVVAG